MFGTHGRSIWRVDIDPVSALDSDLTDQTVHVFEGGSSGWSPSWGEKCRAYTPVFEPESTFVLRAPRGWTGEPAPAPDPVWGVKK